ncbi:GNAT family N-acetyltransferase [Agathobaculum sp.]|uniref:GNAT family N-acetyltransferase n=1 Tax=Agathobaculum sp. TaxID=2048138 RepID=UPI0039A07678
MIRFAGPQDAAAIRRLWEVCFPDEGGFNDYFFAHHFDITKTLLSVEGGELCAMVQMLPYRLMLDGREAEITYIYGACTDPAHRRKGHMARLLEHSFALDRAEGRAASALIPAEKWLFDFYKPFGYEPFFYIEKQEITREGSGILPRRLTQDDIPQLTALYETHTTPCRIARDAAYWQAQLTMFDALGCGAYGWFEGGNLTAYAFCWEDNAQEALGMTPAQAQGLLEALSRDSLAVVTAGQGTALGCIKWHEGHTAPFGYMNLMFN